MKKISLLVLPLIAFTGCDVNTSGNNNGGGGARQAAEEAATAPSRYVGANIQARNQAQVTSALSTVNNAIRMYNVSEGQNPSSLSDLTQKGYLAQLPDLPSGVSYNYNSRTGEVTVTGY